MGKSHPLLPSAHGGKYFHFKEEKRQRNFKKQGQSYSNPRDPNNKHNHQALFKGEEGDSSHLTKCILEGEEQLGSEIWNKEGLEGLVPNNRKHGVVCAREGHCARFLKTRLTMVTSQEAMGIYVIIWETPGWSFHQISGISNSNFKVNKDLLKYEHNYKYISCCSLKADLSF